MTLQWQMLSQNLLLYQMASVTQTLDGFKQDMKVFDATVSVIA